MKRLFSKIGLTLILSILFITFAQAQGVPEVVIPDSPVGWFEAGRVEWLFGVVVVVGGYLTAFIPGLNQITSGTYRVLTWAILTGAGAIYFGGDILGVAVAYFMSTSLYDVVLKWIMPSPKPKLKE